MYLQFTMVLVGCRGNKLIEDPEATPADTGIVSSPTSEPTQEPTQEPESSPADEPSSEPTSEPDTAVEDDPADREGWTLVWRDEFEDPAIDLTKWEFEVDGQGGGNNELQYYTDRVENAFVENGSLVIEAREESYTGEDGTRSYTSARLRTMNQGDWLYGRIEARMRLPEGQGIWPAFWMLPTDWVYGGWAASGEIDIMELVGHEADTVHGTLHYGGPWPANIYTGGEYVLSEPFSNDYHTFAVEWKEGEIRWYVDDVHYQTQTNWYSTAGDYPAPFNQRFHIILNVAVGGQWPGSPDATTVFPQRMFVDYVRVYEREATDTPEESTITFTVDTSCSGETVSTVALTGPWAGNWEPAQAVAATDNGDGTWSVTRPEPSQELQYLWVLNGQYESLIAEMQNGAECAPVTDYYSYANRVWALGEPGPNDTYGQCAPCP
ncbi:MAG: family 16 glycosylhydrolase [Myxococcota bacterium]|nr:family 16 glycosylhydrolase [Myxococcota bacterium]